MLEIDFEDDKNNLPNGDIPHSASDFCKVNKLGYKGEHENKEGFVLGPSIFKITNKNDPEEMKTYELFAPTIYIKDSPHDDERRPYKLIVARFK